MLIWDETDFITCLETVPVVGEDGTSHTFTVTGSGLRLEIVVWQFDGDVSIRLFRDGLEAAILEITLLDCGAVRYVNDKAGERLEFAPATRSGSRDEGPVQPFAIAVSVKPSIRVRLLGSDA